MHANFEQSVYYDLCKIRVIRTASRYHIFWLVNYLHTMQGFKMIIVHDTVILKLI